MVTQVTLSEARIPSFPRKVGIQNLWIPGSLTIRIRHRNPEHQYLASMGGTQRAAGLSGLELNRAVSFSDNEQNYFFSLWASFVKRARTVSTLFSMVLSDLFKSIVSVSYPLQMSMLLRASTISTTRVEWL